jgi:hypothetical protein
MYFLILFCSLASAAFAQANPAPIRSTHDARDTASEARAMAASLPSSSPLIAAVEPNPVGLTPAQQRLQAARFAERFNKLVEAVEEFSIAYNRHRGQAWPADKAKALQKAMAEIQKVDLNLKPENSDK